MTGKRGLRENIGAGMNHAEPNFFDGQGMTSQKVADFFLYPFSSAEAAPSWGKALVTAILTLLACIVNGWVFVIQLQSANVALTSPTTQGDLVIRHIITGLTAALLYLMGRFWTYDSSLRTYVYPEVVLGSVWGLEIGAVPAIVIAGIQFGGYAIAGAILKHFITAPSANLVNGGGAVLGGQASAMVWFASTLIVFNYLYNMKFWNEDGRPEPQHAVTRRAVMLTAAVIFLVTVCFASSGLVAHTSGLYVTGVIVNGQHAGWVKNTILPLFASSTAGGAIYLFIAFLIWLFGERQMPVARVKSEVESANDRISASANYASNSSNVRARKPINPVY